MYWPCFFEHLPPLAITKWQCNIFHWLCLSNCNDSVQVRAVWQAPWMMKEVKLSLVIHPQGSLMYFNSKPYTGEKNKETKMKCRISFWFPHQRCQQVISISEKKDVSVLFSRICTAYGIPLKASVYCNKFETKEGSFRCLLINVKTLRSKNKR